MRKISMVVPLLSLAAGVGGFYLRSVEQKTVFDPLTGLAERGAPVTVSLVALTASFLLAVIAFAIVISKTRRSPKGFENAFGTDPILYPLIFVAVGLVWIGGTITHLFKLIQTGTLHTFDISFLIMSVLSAICISLFAIMMYQDPRRKSPYALIVVPIVFLCLWLVSVYRENAANPVLSSFVYQCLAIVASTLNLYFTAGFLYGKPAPGKAIVSYCATVYFCCITLADGLGLGIILIVCAIIAATVTHMFMFLRNLIHKWY